MDQSILRRGLIITNDPFLQQIEVQTIGSDVEFIRCTQLRPLDWKPAPNEVANSIEDKFMEQPTMKHRVLSIPEKQRRVKKANKVGSQADLLQLQSERGIVPLTVAPWRNAILEKDSIGKFYNETNRIELLFINGEQKVAMAKLRGTDNELLFIQLPASVKSLLSDKDYHTDKSSAKHRRSSQNISDVCHIFCHQESNWDGK